MTAEAAKATFELVWAKRWEQPICPPEVCTHPAAEKLSINQRLEPTKRGQHVIGMDACVCMNCGADTTGHLGLIDGISRCWDEHHLRPGVADRLYDLVAAREEAIWAEGEAFPIWFMYAFGWDGRRIVAALNAGDLVGQYQHGE